MDDRSAKLFWDALQAAVWVRKTLAGVTLADFLDHELRRMAIERQLSIMGEALSVLRRTDAELAAIIPDLARIIGFRNRLIHAYESIDYEQVWIYAQQDVPALIQFLQQRLDEYDRQSSESPTR